jgi:hypothetical protein
MKSAEIVQLLSELPHVQVTASPGHITVDVPGSDDSARLSVFRVRSAERITLPGGEPGVGLGIRGDGNELRPLIITSHAIGYAPASPDNMLDSKMKYGVSNIPDFVTYSEMERDAQALAGLTKADLIGRNLMEIVGSMLLVRCFIVGAIRVGLQPVRALSAWERAWSELGEFLPMPDFRPDQAWDELRASELPAAAPAGSGEAADEATRKAALAGLSVADFEALGPRLTISRLDEEFVGLWREWMPVHPARFAEVLFDGLENAQAELVLYPDGGGGVDLTVEADGECIGLLQLGFSFWDGEFSLDEVSTAGAGQGSGLFQRFMANMTNLAELLGFEGVNAYFTGVGSYAGARMGFQFD